MPPKNIKTIGELIYWEYAKLISGSAVGDKKNYGFVMHTFKKLKDGKISLSQIFRENKILIKSEKCCVYCGAKDNLHWEHIIPKSKGGPDNIDNIVLACKKCNLSKGDKDIFKWYGLEKRYEIPRIVLGKYLKLIFELHQKNGTLNTIDLNKDGKLDVYDLGAVLMRKGQKIIEESLK